MRITPLVIVGIIISFFALLILASKIENGDMSAASMYLLVFAIPVIIILLLNGFFLVLAQNTKSKLLKLILIILPILILTLLSLKNYISFGVVDGNLVLAARVTVVIVGLTNIVWSMTNLRIRRN